MQSCGKVLNMWQEHCILLLNYIVILLNIALFVYCIFACKSVVVLPATFKASKIQMFKPSIFLWQKIESSGKSLNVFTGGYFLYQTFCKLPTQHKWFSI